MTTSSGDASAMRDECPINLRYVDSTPNNFDIDAIVHGGRRIRRRRATTASVGAAGVFTAVAVVALTMPQLLTHHSAAQTGGIYNSTTLESFPPVDQIVALGTYTDAQPSNWSAIAWISQNGSFCHGAADMSARSSEGSVSLSCESVPAELTTAGPTELIPGWPVFQTAPSKTGAWLAVGVLRGTAAKVQVTANGQTAGASVYPLATTTGEAAGAYAVWLRAEPDGSMRSSDITRIQALDSNGRVVAQTPMP